jgi:hypothetical protein
MAYADDVSEGLKRLLSVVPARIGFNPLTLFQDGRGSFAGPLLGPVPTIPHVF